MPVKTPADIPADSLPCASDRLAELKHEIEHAAHLLPAQGPITVFIHHNTLHAFEHLPFEEAVEKGAHRFGCHPYLPEERYRAEMARGRIRPDDIEAVLLDDLGDRASDMLGILGTRFRLRQVMLQHALRVGPSAELRWIIEETEALRKFREEISPTVREQLVAETRHWYMRDVRNGGVAPDSTHSSSPGRHNYGPVHTVLERFESSTIEQWSEETWEAFHLHVLWRVCRDAATRAPQLSIVHELPVRARDVLLELTGQDSDELVSGVLIRFCSAFLDQGFSNWSLPGHELGFLNSFCALYAKGYVDRWMRGLQPDLALLQSRHLDPLESIDESLNALGVDEEDRPEYLAQTLLALRGWAGMIWQIESRGDRVAHPAAAGSLVEYVAVRLLLERAALEFLARESFNYDAPLDRLREFLLHRLPPAKPVGADRRAFPVFQLAQLLGWSPSVLCRLHEVAWNMIFREVEAFSGIERRRIFHRAFERRYRIQTLDAIAAHSRRSSVLADFQQGAQASENEPERPRFQIVTCIDEREESFRRHLEEIVPDCETFSTAGFFAVAMYYRGAADAHYTPSCPVVIKPLHYVRERPIEALKRDDRSRRRRRRAIGTVTHRVHIGSRTFAGGWLAAFFGSLASIPLVMRILFPRPTAHLARLFGGFVHSPTMTQLRLERTLDPPGPDNVNVGYNVAEMSAIVERLLCDIGLTKQFSKIVVIAGHGSSSLNNPHESAYNCGACGGGSGGPNARAFAQMANDPRVRNLLSEAGLAIPSDTYFVGAHHNTCDDSVTWYDLEHLPESHRDEMEFIRENIDQARRRNAHERCRRFVSAELNLDPDEALRHVEGRSEDLSQARPECGHATNALFFIGRRAWSKGLFLDRRAFLQSYDPAQDDDESTILTRILQAVIPVCAGINLEYYFSYVDPTGYGCGTKLPHNITSLIGVMNGSSSDLLPGLPWQMVEIHEPVRLLLVVETTPSVLSRFMEHNPQIARLFRGGWVQLATFEPQSSEVRLFRDGEFEPYRPESRELPEVAASADWYRGWREHLGFARVTGSTASPPLSSSAGPGRMRELESARHVR